MTIMMPEILYHYKGIEDTNNAQSIKYCSIDFGIIEH